MTRSFASGFALVLSSSVMISAPAQDDLFPDDDVCEEGGASDDDSLTAIEAELRGPCEVPSVSTTGTGTFTAEIDEASSTMTWSLSYADLVAPVEQAHIHFGQEHTNGGISIFLCTNLGNGPADTQACPEATGTIEGTITETEVVGPTEQGINAGEFAKILEAIRSGAAYANVHTTTFPAGEIRGQVVPADDD